jgi:septum formation protein
MRPLILASQSSWRKTILEKLGIPFDVVVSNFEEDMTQKLPPHELALALANGKARTVALMHPDALIIAADTFIIFGDELMGKPGTPDRAIEMLTKLSGKWHEIITGFVIIDGQTGQIHEEVVYTRVHLRDAGKEEIEDYVATGEPLNVAGGYAIQGRAGALIDRIEGDYWNIAGLPMSALTVALKKFGITPQ